MEMSRQRIRSSVLESSTDKCPHCGGTGHVRSVSSVALHLLRMLEEMLLKGATHNLIVRTRTEVALYALNHKRAHLRDLESRFQITITVTADDDVGAAQPFTIEKGEQAHSPEEARAIVAQQQQATPVVEAEDEEPDEAFEDEADEEGAEEDGAEREPAAEGESEEPADASAEGDNGHRRGGRRRRRGRGRGREGVRDPREGSEFPREAVAAPEQAGAADGEELEAGAEHETQNGGERPANGEQDGDAERRRRRRGRRGGRRNRRGREGEGEFAGRPNGGPDDQPHHLEHGVEPEIADASADLGGPSREEAPYPAAAHTPQPFEPAAREPEPAPAPIHAHVPEPEPVAPAEPKRRSTVREPAPMFSSGAMSDVQPAPVHEAPPPEPAATAAEPAAAAASEAKPRRFGWWNKKG